MGHNPQPYRGCFRPGSNRAVVSGRLARWSSSPETAAEMVAVAQLVELLIVVQAVASSSLVSHPEMKPTAIFGLAQPAVSTRSPI